VVLLSIEKNKLLAKKVELVNYIL